MHNLRRFSNKPIAHSVSRFSDKPRHALRESSDVDIQREVRRALAKVQEAQEILSGLIEPDESSIEELLLDRADELGSKLTKTELEVMSKFIEGQSTETIAEERGLSARTIGNQLRAGCHKLGFKDRREMKGWIAAVRQFRLTQPPED